MQYRAGFNYDRDEVSWSTGVMCNPEEGRTQQQFKDDCDINTIVKRFGLTGKVPVGLRMPESGDFTGAVDFHTAMNMVNAAQAEFMKVPADIRMRFHENPQKFMDWLYDPASREEATKLGFFKVPDVPRTDPPAQPAA